MQFICSTIIRPHFCKLLLGRYILDCCSAPPQWKIANLPVFVPLLLLLLFILHQSDQLPRHTLSTRKKELFYCVFSTAFSQRYSWLSRVLHRVSRFIHLTVFTCRWFILLFARSPVLVYAIFPATEMPFSSLPVFHLAWHSIIWLGFSALILSRGLCKLGE